MLHGAFRTLVAVSCVAVSIGGVGIAPSQAANEILFTVNSVADGSDQLADGVCQTVTPGECSLRAALQESRNARSDVRISFDIPGPIPHRIRTYSTLPRIDNQFASVTIDGTSQPGYVGNNDSLAVNTQFGIELVGSGGTAFHGIVIESQGNVVRGLNFHSFKKHILLSGSNAAYNDIVGVMIGLTPSGSYDPLFALNSGSSCIELISGAHHNRLGLPGNENRNVISGCDQKGIALYNTGTSYNSIQNSIVGLDPSGTQRRGTKSHGIDVNSGASNTLIGGLGWQERNVISGNFQSGVEISHGSTTNYHQVIGNLIGTDLAGTGFSAATVNGQIGIRLEGKATCVNACGLDAGYETVADNVVVNSALAGIYVDKGVHDSTIARNLIGVLANGTAAPNVGYGMRIEAGATRMSVIGNTVAFNGRGIQIMATGAMPAHATSSPTHAIQLITNLVHSNGGSYQIDIAPFGLPNDSTRGNSYVNNDVRIPTLSNMTATSVRATTCGGCTVELFAASPTLWYGGAVALVTSGVANASGLVTLSFAASSVVRKFTALATNLQNGTSEFARNVTVPALVGG